MKALIRHESWPLKGLHFDKGFIASTHQVHNVKRMLFKNKQAFNKDLSLPDKGLCSHSDFFFFQLKGNPCM